MISTNQIDTLLSSGGSVVASDGAKIGKIGQIFLDDVSGEPEWVTVQTGLFGTKENFVPLDHAELSGDTLTVPFTKDVVKDAPQISADEGHLSEEEEAALYRHYGREYAGHTGELPADDSSRGADYGAAGYNTAGYTEADTTTADTTTDDAMTRSEEQVQIGTERKETGRVRLRKYIVTENVTQTVPVSREEVRLEREPITDENRGDALSGKGLTEDEHEVVLTEERPVIKKETVPVERVRLDKETVTGEEQVSESVRKEQVELAADDVDEQGTRR